MSEYREEWPNSCMPYTDNPGISLAPVDTAALGNNPGIKMRIGLLASGEGTNMQSIIDACASGELAAEPAVMIGNNSTAKCFDRARSAGIPTIHISGVTHPDPTSNDRPFETLC